MEIENNMDDTERPERPFALGAVAFIFSAQAVILPILFFVFLLTPPTSLMMFNGKEVAVGEVRLEVLATMLVGFAFAAYVGPGLWRGNPTARNVAFSIYAGFPLILLTVRQAWASLIWLVIPCAIIGWYLYRKPNVRDFFSTYQAT